MRNTLLTLIVAAAGTGCASGPKAMTWQDVGPSEPVRRAGGSSPEARAAGMFSDDACVAEAERTLATDPDGARELMKACVHRDDFMLTSHLADPRWRGMHFGPEDYAAILRAELRKGSPDDIDLTPFHIQATPLLDAPAHARDGALFFAYVQVDKVAEVRGKEGVVVRPITYGATDKSRKYLRIYDLVDLDTGNVIVPDAKRETITKTTGSRHIASLVDDPIFLTAGGVHALAPGQRYVVLVNQVHAGKETRLAGRVVAVVDSVGR